jgi:hypothetical protein
MVVYSLFNIRAVNKKKIKIPPRYNNKIRKVKYSIWNCNNKIEIKKITTIKQKIDINVFKENKI